MPESDADDIIAVDLAQLARTAKGWGPAWAYGGEDLNVNLIFFDNGGGVEEHENHEVDVLLIGVEGEGQGEINGHPFAMQAGRLLLIPKGQRRSIRSAGGRFAYLTCHRRRRGLWPTTNPEFPDLDRVVDEQG